MQRNRNAGEDKVTANTMHDERGGLQSLLRGGVSQNGGFVSRAAETAHQIVAETAHQNAHQNAQRIGVWVAISRGCAALIDREDQDLVLAHKWSATPKRRHGVGWYAASRIQRNGNRRTLLMHRLILGLTDGRIEVDHIHGDTLDNRRSQLRVCTHGQNAKNRGKNPSNRSGYRGVHWDKQSQKWRAEIWSDGKHYRLGRFDRIDDAVAAFAAACTRLHGEFGRIA